MCLWRNMIYVTGFSIQAYDGISGTEAHILQRGRRENLETFRVLLLWRSTKFLFLVSQGSKMSSYLGCLRMQSKKSLPKKGWLSGLLVNEMAIQVWLRQSPLHGFNGKPIVKHILRIFPTGCANHHCMTSMGSLYLNIYYILFLSVSIYVGSCVSFALILSDSALYHIIENQNNLLDKWNRSMCKLLLLHLDWASQGGYCYSHKFCHIWAAV